MKKKKKLEKEQNKPKANGRKVIIKIKAEINSMKTEISRKRIYENERIGFLKS